MLTSQNGNIIIIFSMYFQSHNLVIQILKNWPSRFSSLFRHFRYINILLILNQIADVFTVENKLYYFNNDFKTKDNLPQQDL